MDKKKKNYGFILISALLISIGIIGVVFVMSGNPIEALAEETPVATTFSAIMAAPAATGYTVNDEIGVYSASFVFDFSEQVKNNGLNGSGFVTLSKVSGGSQSVASDGAIVASTVTGEHITFTSMGTGGSKTTTFTVEASVLEAGANYQLKLLSAVSSNTSPVKTLGEDIIYTFVTASEPSVPTVTFSAISLYPTNGIKDVATDADFVVGFNEPITSSSSITNGKAIELIDAALATTLPAVFTVSNDLMSITINPNVPLDYGKDYQLRIVDGKIKNIMNTPLSSSMISFKTTSFSQVTASAITSGATGAGLDIEVILTNATGKVQKVKIGYVIRRDKGARLEDGGTVVLSGTTPTDVSCQGNIATSIPLTFADVTKDQFGNLLTRAIYVDIYVMNNGGEMLTEPMHISAQQL